MVSKRKRRRSLWIRAFIDWYQQYETFINEKTVDEVSGRWWFTHKMLHRSVSHIKRAILALFSYTRYPNVSKSSNSIESFFGHLKDNLRIHRGLSEQHFKDFVKWYLFLNSNDGYQKKRMTRIIQFWSFALMLHQPLLASSP